MPNNNTDRWFTRISQSAILKENLLCTGLLIMCVELRVQNQKFNAYTRKFSQSSLSGQAIDCILPSSSIVPFQSYNNNFRAFNKVSVNAADSKTKNISFFNCVFEVMAKEIHSIFVITFSIYCFSMLQHEISERYLKTIYFLNKEYSILDGK